MKFLFCSLDAPGFLFPSIRVALDLKELGHEVAFVTAPSTSEFLAGCGIKRIAFGDQDRVSFDVSVWARTYSILEQLRHILAALKQFPADVLVGQPLTLGPLMAKRMTGMPLGVIGLATYLWPTGDDSREGGAFDVHQRRLRWRYQDMLRHYNAALSRVRMATLDPPCRKSPFLGDLYLLRSVRKLEGGIDGYPPQVHLVGSCCWEPEPRAEAAELREWLARCRQAGRRVVYVQHGRTFRREKSWWEPLLSALGDGPLAVAASTLRLDRDQGELPANFFARPHLPQGQVFGLADAMISSATSAVVLGSLQAGVPSLLIPYGGEQPDLARRCHLAGSSVVLNLDEVSPRGIQRALREILTAPAFSRRARELQRSFSEMEGDKAARLLERLGRGQPVVRPDPDASIAHDSQPRKLARP